MAKYIDAEKLIAEIKRRISSWSIREKFSPVGQGKDTCISRVTELSDLLSFIDSLQQEQPEVDLEKEIDACWQNWLSPSNQSSVEGVLPKSEFSMYAHHFVEWGRKQVLKEIYDGKTKPVDKMTAAWLDD